MCVCACVNALPTHRVVLFLLCSLESSYLQRQMKLHMCRRFTVSLIFQDGDRLFQSRNLSQEEAFVCHPSSSSQSLPPLEQKLTGSIPGGGTQDSLFMVTVTSLKHVVKTPPALKDQRKNSFSHKLHRIYRKYGSLVN